MRAELKQTIDWSQVSREDYLLAMQRSPVKDLEIKELLKPALSADLENITLFAHSIDASYAYEGYTAYNTNDLRKR